MPTDDGVARLRVELRDGRSVVAGLRDAMPLALRRLGAPGPVLRIGVVQTAAMLVAGDDVSLEVEVGPGAALEIEEISATLAHPVAADGAAIRQRARYAVAAGARLAILERPLVVAAGTRLERRTDVVLEGDARCLHRETVVLGRDGEEPGAAAARVRVVRDGEAVLDDTLATDPRAVLRSPAVLGGAGAVSGLGLYGVVAPEDDVPGALALGPRDTLVRVVHDGADAVEPALERLTTAWRALLHRAPAGASAQRGAVERPGALA